MGVPEDQRKAAEVYTGQAVFSKKSMELMDEFGLPSGLLPLTGVEECGIVRETGFIWIVLKKEMEHYFKLAGRRVSFGTEITAVAASGQLKNITGIKAREMMLWVEVKAMEVEQRKIRFRALAGITRSFPVDCFAAV
ncbi:uncharacterized protein LOC112350996 [Selaginella moellendorffii]|uniref:uncharacterized protein LOC112350996 n=1 Tax=Selaginella moellendorffii TaxID=88036 RepID=UPI000D1C9B93|nr:uncharacterized protein LOC112350996 [Selaginella moellendorffii]|eukprot:XP_024543856.1 uncharacterized protein LOC112350996 [Selaginella moellendorffii]